MNPARFSIAPAFTSSIVFLKCFAALSRYSAIPGLPSVALSNSATAFFNASAASFFSSSLARVELERRERERKAREEAEALQRKLDAEVAEANRKSQEEARKRAEEEQRIKREKEEAEAKERGAKEAELAALAKKQEEERQEAIRKAEAEAKANAVTAPTVVSPVVQDAPRVTRTEAGSASQRKTWTFKVVDPALVPREYLLVSDNLIRDGIKQGVRSIPGIEIFEQTSTIFRS